MIVVQPGIGAGGNSLIACLDSQAADFGSADDFFPYFYQSQSEPWRVAISQLRLALIRQTVAAADRGDDHRVVQEAIQDGSRTGNISLPQSSSGRLRVIIVDRVSSLVQCSNAKKPSDRLSAVECYRTISRINTAIDLAKLASHNQIDERIT
jgi:hypothetical protein